MFLKVADTFFLLLRTMSSAEFPVAIGSDETELMQKFKIQTVGQRGYNTTGMLFKPADI